MERPFYVSDAVLKPALIGLAHQCIDQSELPEALAPAIAELQEQILDPIDYAWSLIGLVFTYESAYVDCPVNSISAADGIICFILSIVRMSFLHRKQIVLRQDVT